MPYVEKCQGETQRERSRGSKREAQENVLRLAEAEGVGRAERVYKLSKNFFQRLRKVKVF